MRYGDGAVQWMTAGRGMLHEEMWDVEADTDAELYQLWVNLPPSNKMEQPRVQLIVPEQNGREQDGCAEVQREGSTPVGRSRVIDERLQGGAVRVRTLAHPGAPADAGADTYSPMVVQHVEIEQGGEYTLPLPEGWTCIVYVRRGAVAVGGDSVSMFETAYLSRSGGDGLALASVGGRADVLVLAGEPIGAPVVSSGTMVMNTDAEVQQALYDYQRGDFGTPWDHTLSDDEWATQCDVRSRRKVG